MNCPPEVAEILLKILDEGLIRIRALGWSGDPQRCALEADHLHNLPSLIAKFSRERLEYYWKAERPGFIEASSRNGLTGFEPLWERLHSLLQALPVQPD
jgi:hypothetical protein